MTKNRNESTISLLFSRRRHSHNRRVDSFFKLACFLWLRNTENVRFESYAIVFDDAIYCCQDVPVVQSWTRSHGLSELCLHNGTQDEKNDDEIMIIRDCLSCTFLLWLTINTF